MILLYLMSGISFSEDIELYLNREVRSAGKKPQVLVILDNSGSMTTEISTKEGYKPGTTYPAIGSDNALNDSFTYFVYGGVDGTGIAVPTHHNEARRFINANNSCQAAIDTLNTTGFYTGYVLEYKDSGKNKNTWDLIPDNNGANPDLVDCSDDINNSDPTNASISQQGYPINNSSSTHTSDKALSNVNWGGSLLTLYSANYLRWYHNASAENTLISRMQLAIDSITNIIQGTPSIDFGLQVFNLNASDDANHGNGGRIVYGIKTMDATNKAAILDIINNKVSAKTNTPLCETLYEASLYFGGKAVDFGDDDISWGSYYSANQPPRDLTVENSDDDYISPFKDCTGTAYVILITDGEPTEDKAADTKIEALSVVEDGTTVNFSGSRYDDNYLPAMANWMLEHDINPGLKGVQNVKTYTIGFSEGADDAAPLLKETAKLGGGLYFKATDGVQLTTAILGVLADLEPTNNSLTSASVAANNFDRTETLNSVYYAMFDPQSGPRWQGNLKKYKVVSGKQIGRHDKEALNNSTGHFSEDVTSFWSPSNSRDGSEVAAGGVAEVLRKKTDRVIYSDLGTNKLELLTQAKAEVAFTNKAGLAAALNVAEDDIGDYLDWAKGKNVDNVKLNDGTIPTMRPDVFGDPLHSTPVVINYGTTGTGDEARDNVRIILGTNAGALHMFEDKEDTVDETWAFMPKEFFSNYKILRENNTTVDKVYGIDGKITSYKTDLNGDGIVNGSDKVWIFFGLRRGGTSYYALDVTTPGTPELLWHIESGDTGFEKLAQTWSQPKVGFSKLNISDGTAKPVLFFGGGYDPVKDAAGTPTASASDTDGKAIYMVDAETGTLKWSLATAGTTAFSGSDSIPAAIGMLDSDGDGLTDRLYAGDTGGNVWRIDMPSDNPKDTDNPWTVFKLASVGGITDATDKRFFNEPSIVRTFISETIETSITDEEGVTTKIASHQEVPYDAVLLGSGDRSNPLGTDTKDTFYMFKDNNVQTQSFSSSSTPVTPTPIVIGELYNYSDDPFSKSLTTQARQVLEIAVSKKSGWYVDYGISGEKTSAEAIVINGVAYFTSYSPPDFSSGFSCGIDSGRGWLYAIDLALGTKKYNWTDAENYDGSVDDDDRKLLVNEQFLGAPTLIVIDDSEDEDASEAYGDIIVGRKIIPVGFSLLTLRTHLYITEDQ